MHRQRICSSETVRPSSWHTRGRVRFGVRPILLAPDWSVLFRASRCHESMHREHGFDLPDERQESLEIRCRRFRLFVIGVQDCGTHTTAL